MNNKTTLFGRSIGLFLAAVLIPTALFSQLFSDDFESGSYTPTWAAGTGTYTRTVTTTAPASGTYCFEQVGGTSNHFDGVTANFASTQADSVVWNIKTTSASFVGYMVVGDDNSPSNSGIAFTRFSDAGNINFYKDAGTQFDYPISINTWYEVKLKDIDWVNKEFDIYINGALQYTNFPFRSNASTEITRVDFYNYDSGTAYLDEVAVYGAPPCTTAPTAVCQDVNVYLDAAGNASIVASDLDGGSIDNCGTTGLTFSASQTAFTCADISSGGSPSDALVVTGVIDGPLPGGLPKAIELYATANIPDLSLYGVSSANNGTGATGAPEYTFPADAITAGQFIYIATDSVNFNSWFGFFPNYTNGMASINGDDAIEVFYSGNVVDVFGDVNVDGTGQPWEHLDGWAYRNNGTGPDGSTFVLGSWSFSGVDALDGETTNAGAATPFPVGTYMPAGSGTAVTLTVTDGNLNSANCVANVSVLDTISPTASQPAQIMVQCLSDVPAVDPLIFTDEADNCAAPTVAFVSEISSGSCPEILTRTYSITDASGNSINVDHIIMINDDTAPTASNPATINVECQADVPAPDVLEVNDEADNCSVPVVTWIGDVSDGLSCPETITRTYGVTDDCGNSIMVTQLIVVQDVTAAVPVIASLSPIAAYCEVANPPIPTATDNCDLNIDGVADVTFPITTPGTTTVTWTYTDACGNISTQTQDMTVNVFDLGTTVSGLTISSLDGGAPSYQWIDCSDNSVIAGETSQDFTAISNGDYAVILSDGNCSDTSACVNINNVGINDLTTNLISVYPNPSKDGIFTIQYEGQLNSIVIVDMVGKIVDASIDLKSGVVDASTLSAGRYSVRVATDNDQVIVQTVVIQ